MAPPVTLWQRNALSEIDNVKNTFSSWDSCMSEAYCKWPVIVGIIVASLIVLSILWCFVKILFCGAECCFCFAGCLRCCTCCCRSSGRSDRSRAPAPDPYAQNQQYRSAAPPMYMTTPQYAQFDAPSKTGYRSVNEDALPSMPGWDNASTRRIEDHSPDERDDEAVELSKMEHQNAQMQPMLASPSPAHGRNPYEYNPRPVSYDNRNQNTSYPSADTSYSPTNTLYTQPSNLSVTTTSYGAYNRVPGHENPISPSIYSSYGGGGNEYYAQAPAPPSYHSRAPSQGGVGRKPVSGSWREI